MAASDPDIRVADGPSVDLFTSHTKDGEIVFYDPTSGDDTYDSGRWIRVSPECCVDLNESH